MRSVELGERLAVRYVICPRECSARSPANCFGKLENHRARCIYCGRWIPLEFALEFLGGFDD